RGALGARRGAVVGGRRVGRHDCAGRDPAGQETEGERAACCTNREAAPHGRLSGGRDGGGVQVRRVCRRQGRVRARRKELVATRGGLVALLLVHGPALLGGTRGGADKD